MLFAATVIRAFKVKLNDSDVKIKYLKSKVTPWVKFLVYMKTLCLSIEHPITNPQQYQSESWLVNIDFQVSEVIHLYFQDMLVEKHTQTPTKGMSSVM